MFNILAVVLGIAAVAVYMKGVRYDKPGANPVFILLVVAAIVSVLLPFTGIPERMAQRRIAEPADIYPVFRDLFKKRMVGA